MFEISLAILGIILSAFFSGAELAFITANPLQMEVWMKQRKAGAGIALKFLGDPDEFLLTVLVGTTLSNILATSFATAILVRSGWYPMLVLFLVASVILIFGEVLPKTLFRERPNQFLRVLAPIFRVWKILFFPLNITLKRLNQYLSGNRKAKTTSDVTVEREELRHLFARDSDRNILRRGQQELISQVFAFGETPVSKVMTPRTAISAIPATADLQEVHHNFIESGHSKLPVYRDSLDDIIGVAYLYDLFKNPPGLSAITRPVTMIPSSNETRDVLRQLQTARHSIAVVLDEFGGTAGLVTVEDLFEELFGEFEDEFDTRQKSIAALGDGTLLVAGKAEIEDLNRIHHLGIPSGDYETIAGYLVSVAGRIPYSGERLHLPIGQAIIKKASARHIDQVQIIPFSTKTKSK